MKNLVLFIIMFTILTISFSGFFYWQGRNTGYLEGRTSAFRYATDHYNSIISDYSDVLLECREWSYSAKELLAENNLRVLLPNEQFVPAGSTYTGPEGRSECRDNKGMLVATVGAGTIINLGLDLYCKTLK